MTDWVGVDVPEFTHGLDGYKRHRCRCEVCRVANTEDHRRFTRAYREQHGVPYDGRNRPRKNPMPESFKCAGCGCELRHARSAEPRCNPCWKGRLAVLRAAANRRKRALARLAVAMQGVAANPLRMFVQGACAECGGEFCGRGGRFCSRRCRDRAKRKWITNADRRAIYERDGWVCQLCSGPVDPGLDYLDDWAATLDHIECRAWALVPDHSPANLRLAHRWCNSVRGDESFYSEGDLRCPSLKLPVRVTG